VLTILSPDAVASTLILLLNIHYTCQAHRQKFATGPGEGLRLIY